MAQRKGPGLEELVRSYFAHQGYFALRGVPFRFEGEEVTDVDVWLYGRQAASGRVRVVVDAKDKRSPKALERILWTKGLQALLSADRAIVVTTESNPRVARFARNNRISVITKALLQKVEEAGLGLEDRVTGDELLELIKANPHHKQDGDWLKQLGDAKAALISFPGFPAFNAAMSGFSFFAERAETRTLHKEVALRAAFLCAALAAVALDMALERVYFEDAETRQRAIADGVTFGDTGDGRAQRSIQNVLSLISESMENGRVLALQAQAKLEDRFSAVRADIVAEYFSKEENAQHLFKAARELEAKAHDKGGSAGNGLGVETKAVLGVLADFARVRRTTLFRASSDKGPGPADRAGVPRLI